MENKELFKKDIDDIEKIVARQSKVLDTVTVLIFIITILTIVSLLIVR